MSKIKELYNRLKENGLLDKDVLIPTGLAIASHTIAGYPTGGDWNNMLYSTIPPVDSITHFLGGYAVSQIIDKLYEPLSRKYESVKKISKDKFVIGTSLALGGLNEIGEKIATSIPGMEIFYEPVENSIKDLFVDAGGILTQRYVSRKRKNPDKSVI